ncbi:MAG: cytochrome-c peroxidase, partial [Bryobacteraceae bacterium]
IALVIGCQRKSTETVDPAKLKLFQPLPAVAAGPSGPPSEELISLGRMLYYDPRLSKSQKISCNSCHDLNKYGVDNQPTSDGHKGQKGDRNSPSVYNAALQFAQFWDGRAAHVEEQAKGPVLNPVEMAMPSDKLVIAVLKSIPEYVQAFRRAFPSDEDPVTMDNVARAIGAFERKLLTPARWDKFLAGDAQALTPQEKTGLNAFLDAGCQTCHSGVLLGGDMFQRLGAAKPYPDQSDLGRYRVTKRDADRMVFKVPPLRNVEKTAPYFHTGKVATLEEAVQQMAEYQLGKSLSRREIESIVTFLRSLTGEIPADYIKTPELPGSTPRTPPPDTSD